MADVSKTEEAILPNLWANQTILVKPMTPGGSRGPVRGASALGGKDGGLSRFFRKPWAGSLRGQVAGTFWSELGDPR